MTSAAQQPARQPAQQSARQPTQQSRHSPELRAAARQLGRRRFLTVTGAAAALAFATNLPGGSVAHAAELDAAKITENPFTLGVASGDPLPGSVLLWTRLAPQPYAADGGLPAERVSVEWQIAHDARFRRIARRGTTTAHPEFNHSVHVEVDHLGEDRVYYYRFRVGSWISPTGRTRTAPGRGAKLSDLRIAAVSCQAYHDGYWTAYKHLAEEDIDVVFHLGDYLYEYAVTAAGGNRNYTDRVLPAHYNRETVTLEDYRMRYGLYKSDPDLMAAHAAHPFVVTWDDHETENNYAGEEPENSVPPEEFLLRRAAAYRAYWENQPLRRPQQPAGPDMQLYRRLQFGRHAQFDILDTRQYRTNQAYGDGWRTPGPESDDPARTLTGESQERWLIDGWRASRARWNIVPQQVVFARRNHPSAGNTTVSMDSWDGYAASRSRVLAGVESSGIENFMVLTGDVHVSYALDIHRDPADPSTPVAGTEIVTTSISSGKDGLARPANWADYLARNPHLKHYDGQRGYVTVELAADHARADFKTVPYILQPGAPITTAGSFVTESGNPGLQPA